MSREFTTHDRRVRVFVSSTLNEAAAERRAVRAAIEELHLTPVMFDQGARPYPPQELYRSYLAQSDVFIGIYAEQYGWVGPGQTVSGLEDEFLLSGDRPKLMYLRSPAPGRDPKLTDMIHRMWDQAGVSSTNYGDPDELHRLVADDLAVLLSERFAAPEQPRGDGLRPVGVPAPATALVGRDDERTRAAALLGSGVRLLTLTGPGGVGKTRLMAAVVGDVAGGFELVAFTDLAAVSDPDGVPAALAASLGIRPEGTRGPLAVVADRLRGRHALLVLDNFEQVATAASGVAELLDECPDLTVLVTSRTALDVRAEQELPVGPLDDAAAVELFAARTRQYRPSFTVTDADAGAVLGIVHRLEGVPLAIELAAARMRLLTPPQLLVRLGDVLDLEGGDRDAPQRQRTLRRTVAWSYDLLAPAERDLLEQLAVFPAGWTLETAEAVVSLPPGADLLDGLSSLIRHSLVVTGERAGAPRLRMYDAVRSFAAECLDASGRRDAVMTRLASSIHDLGVRAGGAQAALDDELDAVRAVLRWGVETDRAALLVRVTTPLSRYLWSRGMLGELAGMIERTAALPSVAGLDEAARDMLEWGRATIAVAVGRTVEPDVLEGVLARARARDDAWLVPHTLFSLALTRSSGDEIGALLREAVDAFRAARDPWGVCLCLIPLGGIALRDGDAAAAVEAHEEALAQARRIDDRHMIGQCLNQLAIDALMTGGADRARDLLVEAADVHRNLPDLEGLAYCLDGFAGVLLLAGRADDAARLLGAADRVREVAGLAVWPVMRSLADDFASAVASAAGSGYAALRAEGATWPPVDALDRAVSLMA